MLHRWMKAEMLTLSTLTLADVAHFLERPSVKSSKTRSVYRGCVVDYLAWLHTRGTVSFQPAQLRLRHHGVPIPKLANDFLARHDDSYGSLHAVVGAFHRWIGARDLQLPSVTTDHVESFLARPALKPASRMHYRRVLLQYLRWLHARGRLTFRPDILRHRRVLPPLPVPAFALEFLRSIEPTRRPGTCQSYRGGVAQFHRWLAGNGYAVETLTRPQIGGYFHFLLDKGLRPVSRIHRLSEVRNYLRWLVERGILVADADDLIRVSDFPKLPQYLPRPLPPDVDRELQRRLARSDDIYCHGLLLMRSTGMRIGELVALECECVRLDPKGRPFLKVPLGKLQNERLVPLDCATYELVQRLLRSGAPGRQWLLEDPPGQQTRYECYSRALHRTAHGLTLAEPLTSHRLRHSYATSLLAGGMSVIGVMKLLGHRDFRMTLRYTAITDETIGREYDEALKHLEARYRMPASAPITDADPVKLLSDVTRWLRTNLDDSTRARPLLKRIQRLQAALECLLSRRSRS